MPRNANHKVLVIGDAMVDRFINVHPTWNPTAKHFNTLSDATRPGGAANTANILRELGLTVSYIFSLSASTNPITKTYIQDKDGRLLMRINGNDSAIPAPPYELRRIVPYYPTVIISDYNKGTIDDAAVDLINRLAPNLFIDTKRPPSQWRSSATFFPNNIEYHKHQSQYNRLANVVHKQGPYGARLLSHGRTLHYHHPPATPTPPIHTIGAGDAFIAAWVYAAVNNMPPDQCLRFAVTFATLSCTYPNTETATLQATNDLLNMLT